MSDLTPVEWHGQYWLKRDDLFTVAGVCGGKARTAETIIAGSTAGHVVTACARKSPQGNIVAAIAGFYGRGCTIHTTYGDLGPEMQAAEDKGARIVRHRPGYTSVITARAKEDAERHDWLLVPFGMEHEAAVEATAKQVSNLPPAAQRLVVPVGSGMSLAGILTGLLRYRIRLPVLGVVVGADPIRRLNRYAPLGWTTQVELVAAGLPYATAVSAYVEDVQLDPIYEAKCRAFLHAGDCLWVIGIREALE